MRTHKTLTQRKWNLILTLANRQWEVCDTKLRRYVGNNISTSTSTKARKYQGTSVRRAAAGSQWRLQAADATVQTSFNDRQQHGDDDGYQTFSPRFHCFNATYFLTLFISLTTVASLGGGDTRRKKMWANLQRRVDKRGRTGKKVRDDTLQGVDWLSKA